MLSKFFLSSILDSLNISIAKKSLHSLDISISLKFLLSLFIAIILSSSFAISLSFSSNSSLFLKSLEFLLSNKLKKLEKKEHDEIEEKNKKLAKALSIDFKDDQLTEEEIVGLMAEIARDEYGDAAFIEDELSRTELKAVISGDDKLEKLVENEKRLREMIRETMQ